MRIYQLILVLCTLYSFSVHADDTEVAKQGIINNIGSKISSSLENLIGGEGDTKVQATVGEDYRPEYSIVTVRPLAAHPGVDAWFVQLQLNDTNIRHEGRLSTNIGVGYRKLSENKNSLTGANVFLDYDQEGNARASIGFELRSSSFEAIANLYEGISSAQTVGSFTERTLGGYEITLVGEVPYFPWANVVANHYEWTKEKNSKDSTGNKLSLELSLTQSLIVDLGFHDSDIDGTSNFAKIMFVYPPKEKTATLISNPIGDTAFSEGDMSQELLSIVRRTDKQIIESEGTGVVMARAD